MDEALLVLLEKKEFAYITIRELCAAPSSITSIYTEERRKGIAGFRVNEFGSTAHLYVAGEKPSFAARFCECYGDGDRQD